IAMQGVQPKGIDENGEAISPVGKTIASIFPYYLEHSRLGGPKRRKALEPLQLTVDDLEAVIMDARSNADRIYKGIFDEYSYVTDTLRSTQPDWIADAREAIHQQQEMVVDN